MEQPEKLKNPLPKELVKNGISTNQVEGILVGTQSARIHISDYRCQNLQAL